ncbi:FGGY-family carbohydrate kinase [Flavisolibacter sp. BT320]|nr:FGGY-family carbohydrate kinase [Flavisolibacter longurius]
MVVAYFIGIDIGTQGARVVLMDAVGNTVATKEEVFPLNSQSREEQSPEQWWTSCLASLKALCQDVKSSIDLRAVKAIGVTSTSGTIIPLNRQMQPLHNAIMYSDGRSAAEAAVCKEASKASGTRAFSSFNASCGLPKMLWFINTYPGKFSQIGSFIHAADFITGRLSGNFSVTDYTNALKSGFDLHRLQWPDYIFKALPIQKEWLQNVVPSGEPIGVLREELALATGLPPTVIITAGMTDGCASQVASGAVNLGDWNTTIGTTLVVKGVTKTEINDPAGAIYCHRHPQGYWMPGGASNTGADWVSRLFGNADINALNERVATLIPTTYSAWPLLQTGERFPFVAPDAKGFAPESLSDAALFAAYMEGVAYIERYAYERIKALSGEDVAQVFTAGGGSNSDTWLTIRSNVLNLPLRKMKNVSGAAGAAVLAASRTHYSTIVEAAGVMIQAEKVILPEKSLVAQYADGYKQFIHVLKQKGYIPE